MQPCFVGKLLLRETAHGSDRPQIRSKNTDKTKSALAGHARMEFSPCILYVYRL